MSGALWCLMLSGKDKFWSKADRAWTLGSVKEFLESLEENITRKWTSLCSTARFNCSAHVARQRAVTLSFSLAFFFFWIHYPWIKPIVHYFEFCFERIIASQTVYETRNWTLLKTEAVQSR